MRKWTAVVVATLGAIALCGCANWNSIHRTSRLATSDGATIITVDAKQRHLLLMPETDAAAKTKWRVCAEAAPDVFSAFAGSFGAKGSKSGGELSIASAETAASIERTQTINLLRESFFRTCERYASGAINRAQFIIQAARDQRSMVSVLAIEQLTGAVRPKPTIISGPGTSATTLSGADAADLIKDYIKARDKAKADRDLAQTQVTTAEGAGGVCADGDAKDEAQCTALKAKLGDAETALKAAQAGLDNAVAIAKDLTVATNATTSAGTVLQGGGITQADISEANLKSVADAVVEITKTATINEPLMFCIAYLSGEIPNGVGGQEVTQFCLEMLEAKQQADQQYLNLPPLTFRNDVAAGRGAVLAQGYDDWRAALIAKITAVRAADFQARLKKFQVATGSAFDFVRLCPDRAACINYLADKANDPFRADFAAHPDRLNDALKQWD
jgi:hypothetical protein